MSVKVSPKYQVVIPKALRRNTSLKPGTRMQVFQEGDCIELVRVGPMRELRGSLKGIDTDVPRE